MHHQGFGRGWGISVGLALMLVATGCGGGSGKLTTGTVDSVSLVQNDPDYQKKANDYTKARVELQTKINKAIKAKGGASALTQKDMTEFRQWNVDLDKKWGEETDAFLKKRFDRIVAASKAVSQDKGIDLVLVDTPGFPTVEYGAVNITQDVELKLQQTPAAAPKK